jgi:hypothetical protein
MQSPLRQSFGIIGSLGSANKISCKKFQSQTKAAVQSFGKLILSWKSDVNQILLLIAELFNICSTGESVFNELFLFNDERLNKFVELGFELVSNLTVEIESLMVQLRLFQYVAYFVL